MSYTNQKSDVILSINAFYPQRAERIINSLKAYDPGCDCTLYVVHNCLDTTCYNLQPYLEVDHNKVKSLWKNSGIKHIFVERENKGQDMGCHWHTFNNHKHDDYKLMFFSGDGTIFHKDGWLLSHLEALSDSSIYLVTPQIGKGHKYPWCARTSFFGISKEFALQLNWPEPLSSDDAHLQEMELFYPQIKQLNKNMMQVGNALEYMNTYSDDLVPDRWYVIERTFIV